MTIARGCMAFILIAAVLLLYFLPTKNDSVSPRINSKVIRVEAGDWNVWNASDGYFSDVDIDPFHGVAAHLGNGQYFQLYLDKPATITIRGSFRSIDIEPNMSPEERGSRFWEKQLGPGYAWHELSSYIEFLEEKLERLEARS